MKVTPTLRSFLVCDKIVIDALTGSPSLIGIYNRILATHDFPHTHSAFIFLALVNGHGSYPVKIRLVDMATQEWINEFSGVVDFRDPLEVSQASISVMMQFQKSGMYGLELHVDNVMLTTYRIRVESMSEVIRRGNPEEN